MEHAGARSEALPRDHRLAKRREYLRVYESGRKLFSRYVVLFFAPNELQLSRLGITATRKLGKAVVRNRVKRWTKEVYRRQRESLDLDDRHLDLVINVKPNAGEVTFAEYEQEFVRLLRRLARESAQ